MSTEEIEKEAEEFKQRFVFVAAQQAAYRGYIAGRTKGEEERSKENPSYDQLMKEWGNDNDGAEPLQWVLKHFNLDRKF